MVKLNLIFLPTAGGQLYIILTTTVSLLSLCQWTMAMPVPTPPFTTNSRIVDCDKCKDFDVKNDAHSLCQFGCSYTIKTNIPENADSASLKALANRILPLLRLMRNFEPTTTRPKGPLQATNSRLQYNPSTGQLEHYILNNNHQQEHQSNNNNMIAQSGGGGGGGGPGELESEHTPAANMHHGGRRNDNNDSRRRRPPPKQQEQEQKVNDDVQENPDLSVKAPLPLAHTTVEIRQDLTHNYSGAMDQTDSDGDDVDDEHENENHGFSWIDQLSSFLDNKNDDSRSKNVIKEKPVSKSLADEDNEENQLDNEIPDEEQVVETKKIIKQDPRKSIKTAKMKKGQESNLLEMFYNEDSSLIESKRFKKD